MTKTLDEMIAVMQAAREGKKIEYRVYKEEKWYEHSHPEWDWTSYDYRVAPEQPETVDSVAREMLATLRRARKHMPSYSGYFACILDEMDNRIAKAERVLGK